MTFDEAFEKLGALFPESYHTLKFEKNYSAINKRADVRISVYEEHFGWTSDYNTYEEAINKITEETKSSSPPTEEY